ncbi:unnamed protein product, partial [Symbiodinium sp. CCMP2456]
VVQRADPTFDDDLEHWLRRAHHWLAKPKHERNYYRFMSLPMDSSKEDIRKQYRRLCLLAASDTTSGAVENERDAGCSVHALHSVKIENVGC